MQRGSIRHQKPLHKAAVSGHLGVAEALLGARADLHAKDEDGETALREAAANGHLGVAEALLGAGADLRAKDKTGDTALDKVERWDKLAVVALLKARTA